MDGKGFGVAHELADGHALRLVDRDRPRQLQRQLRPLRLPAPAISPALLEECNPDASSHRCGHSDGISKSTL